MSYLEFNFDEIKQKCWDNRKIIIILIMVFLLAWGIRAHLMRYEGNYLFEPDAYYHARMIQELVEKGSVSPIDPQNYYQIEGGMPSAAYSTYWFTSAIIYNIFSLGGAFNKELFAWTIKMMAAVFGALICIFMYFLGKEIFNSKKIGVITAFMAAVVPAFGYRTMAGAQGDNAFGFLWMVIGFIFFVRAVKTKTLTKVDLINVVLAGVFFGLMAMTWRMYILIPIIILPYILFATIFIASHAPKEKKLFKSEPIIFWIKGVGTIVIFSVIALVTAGSFSQDPSFWLFSALGQAKLPIEIGSVLAIIGLIAVAGIGYFVSNLNQENKKAVMSLVILGLYAGLVAMLFVFAIIPDFFYQGDGRTGIGSMVGEESVGVQFFGTKYNALIVLPWVGLFAMPILLYLFNKKENHPQIIFWFWTIFTLFMAWYKLKYTFVFGLGVVTGAALAAWAVFEIVKKYNLGKGIETKVVFGAMFFLLVLGVGASALFFPDYVPSANADHRDIALMDWIKASTPADAKFFNWWNDGHMLAFVTERRFSTDNRNASGEANNDYAEFNITTDVNRGYEIASKEIGADYIILSTDNFSSMTTYEFYVNNKVDSALGAKYQTAPIRILNCSDVSTGKSCNGSIVPTAQYTGFGSTWKSTPDEFYNSSVPIFYYGEKTQLLALNPAVNNTNLAKVWLNSDETKEFYEEVFSYYGIKVFKVKYTN